MPRNIPAELLAHLGGDLLTIALCVKVTRRDGVVMGFTSSNVAMQILGVQYLPEATISPTSIRTTEGTTVDNLEIVGLLQSDRVTVPDIRGGRYAHARVDLFLVNYKDITQGRFILFRGRVANINYQDGQFTFELRALGQRIAQQIVMLTSPKCRVKRLFDAQCFVGGENFDETFVPGDFMHTVTFTGQPTAVILNLTTVDDLATGYLDEGEISFDAGNNLGFAREIKQHIRVSAVSAQVHLHEAFPYAFAVGDTGDVIAGCDRRFTTCVTKFANGGNFRGEPHVPGMDQITRRGRR